MEEAQVDLGVVEEAKVAESVGAVEEFVADVPEPEPVKPQVPVFPTKYHLCSYCGGFKESLAPARPEKPIFNQMMTVEERQNLQNKYDAVIMDWEKSLNAIKSYKYTHREIELKSKKTMLKVCRRCEGKVFDSLLGQSMYFGLEEQHLIGDSKKAGFFPSRKPIYG